MSTDQASELLGERTSLSDRLLRNVAREIAADTYKAGQALPGESGLAVQYGVSKPTVRQGLKKLADLGLILIQHGKRSIVMPESNWNVLDPAVHEAFVATGRAHELSSHLWEVRLLLESAAAGWAAERGTDAELDEIVELTRTLRRIASGTQDVQVFLSVDHEFHELIARVSGNPALRCIVDPTHRFLAGQLWSPGSQSTPNDLSVLADQHAQVATAIRNRDPERARAAMEAHLRFAERLEMSRSKQ